MSDVPDAETTTTAATTQPTQLEYDACVQERKRIEDRLEEYQILTLIVIIIIMIILGVMNSYFTNSTEQALSTLRSLRKSRTMSGGMRATSTGSPLVTLSPRTIPMNSPMRPQAGMTVRVTDSQTVL
jgi:hypothetical protein